MRSLTASFIVMFCVVTFTVGPVAATEPGLPNQPKLFNPATDRIVAMGLPQGETRVWMDVMIPNDNGGIMALCLKYLTTQRIFPAAGPARGGGMFCLADLMVAGPFQWSADVHTFIRTAGGDQEIHVSFEDCKILVEDVTITTTLPTLHTITCPPNDEAATLDASLITQTIVDGAEVDATASRSPTIAMRIKSLQNRDIF